MKESPASDEGILSDIVVDQTITFYGRRFYEEFALRVGNSNLKGYGSLVVDERPYADSGSLISISRNQQVISEVTVYAADRHIEENAELAASQVIERVSTMVFFERLNINTDPDLVGREF